VLDVTLRDVSFRYRGGFALHDISFTFPRGTHTAVSGPSGAGATTLLKVIAGEWKPERGGIDIGQRPVEDMPPRKRPLLFARAEMSVPGRWSVTHALVAAVRQRTLDREDRHHEYRLAIDRWNLESLIDRRIDSLSSSESARVSCARIELLRPGILLADRLLERLNPSERVGISDQFFRVLRVIGTTVISAPSSREELAFADRLAAIEQGQIVQSGSPADVHRRPVSAAVARITGEADLIPIVIRGNAVESAIGHWPVSDPPFQGTGSAIVRPHHFRLTEPGGDSDLIFGIEEAGFSEGRWIAHGLLSGGLQLRIELPPGESVHKGRLLGLRYDASEFTLIPKEEGEAALRPAIPPLEESR
jgi:ABC-type Fe3+/spermidine/putrescine transport system ATPase subunit